MSPISRTLRITGECPDLFALDPSIDHLIIDNCEDEVFIPDLPGVKTLEINRCNNLVITDLDPGLKHFSISDCFEIKYLPHMPAGIESAMFRNCTLLMLESGSVSTRFGPRIPLLVIDRCPAILLETLPPCKELHLMNCMQIDAISFPSTFDIEKLVMIGFIYGLAIRDVYSLKELVLKRAPGMGPVHASINPSLANRLTHLEVVDLNQFQAPSEMSHMEDLVILVNHMVKLPPMPHLESLILSNQGALTNGHEIHDIYEYRMAWGQSRAKRPYQY